MVGISEKKPFSTPKPIGTRPSRTGAKQAWNLNETSFSDPLKQQTWQYATLDRLREEYRYLSAYEFTSAASTETGIWARIAESLCRRTCIADRDYSQQIEKAGEEIEKFTKLKNDARVPATSILVVSGLANQMSEVVPWLGSDSTVLFVEILFLIRSISFDVFCGWCNEGRYFEMAQQTEA